LSCWRGWVGKEEEEEEEEERSWGSFDVRK
jgi:hypothetical protein